MSTPKSLRLIIFFLVILVFILYFALNTTKFEPLLHVSAMPLAIIALCDIATIFINGLFTKLILTPFGKRVPTMESFYISLISSVGNFFAPIGAGFGFRAMYLKKNHDVKYSDYISILSGNYIIVFLVSSFFGLLSLFMLHSESSDRRYGILVGVFAAVFIGSLALSIIRIPVREVDKFKNRRARSLIRTLSKVSEGWSIIVAHRALMARLVSLTIVNFLLTMAITFVIISSLNYQISIAPLLLFSVLGSLSLFINITPANLGVKEAIYLFSSGVLGYSTTQILSISLIDRGIMFIVLAGLWAVSHKLKSPLVQQVE